MVVRSVVVEARRHDDVVPSVAGDIADRDRLGTRTGRQSLVRLEQRGDRRRIELVGKRAFAGRVHGAHLVEVPRCVGDGGVLVGGDVPDGRERLLGAGRGGAVDVVRRDLRAAVVRGRGPPQRHLTHAGRRLRERRCAGLHRRRARRRELVRARSLGALVERRDGVVVRRSQSRRGVDERPGRRLDEERRVIAACDPAVNGVEVRRRAVRRCIPLELDPFLRRSCGEEGRSARGIRQRVRVGRADGREDRGDPQASRA